MDAETLRRLSGPPARGRVTGWPGAGWRAAGWVGLLGVMVAAWGTSPAGGIQTTIGGRPIDLDATLQIREVIEANRATTHDRTLQQLRLRAAIGLTSWLRFDSSTVVANGGPTMKATRAGVYHWHDAFQDVSASVDFDEAYFDVTAGPVDLRIGKQKVAWGKLDRTQPNDLLNPRNYLDPLMQEESEQKLGVPAVAASTAVPDFGPWLSGGRMTAVWVPLYLPYRFPYARCDVTGGVSRCDVERWFPPAAMPPESLTIPLPPGSPVPAIDVPVGFRIRNRGIPGWRLDNGEVGLRYAAMLGEADVALYYFHGFDAQPAFRLTAEALGEPDPNPGNPTHVQNLRGATTLQPEIRTVNAWGADGAYAFDRITVRAEGAFVLGRPLSRDLRTIVADPSVLGPQVPGILAALAGGAGSVPVALGEPSAVTRDVIEWGVGADYTYEGYLLLLQLNQTDVLRNDVDLLIKDVETRLLANLRKNFLSDRILTQVVALHAIESDYTMLRPKLRYRLTDTTSAELGFLFLAGRTHSVLGQFTRNDQGWVRLEWAI